MPTLDAELVARMESLELQARRIADGLMVGGHKSRRHGFAVEFAEHREYVPGDDPRHIDWKVYGRNERIYLKQYELETDLAVWLVVDHSESMRFGSGPQTKYDCAAIAATALGYVVVRQTDAVGLLLFDEQITQALRPSARGTQTQDLIKLLAQARPTRSSQIGAVLHQTAERLPRRGIVAIFSDLFDDPAVILSGLKHLKRDRHEVIVFHTLDGAEIDFPYRRTTLFKGLEVPAELLSDPTAVRDAYLEEFGKYRAELQAGCRALEFDYVEVRTDRDLGRTLAEYLHRRSGRS